MRPCVWESPSDIYRAKLESEVCSTLPEMDSSATFWHQANCHCPRLKPHFSDSLPATEATRKHPQPHLSPATPTLPPTLSPTFMRRVNITASEWQHNRDHDFVLHLQRGYWFSSCTQACIHQTKNIKCELCEYNHKKNIISTCHLTVFKYEIVLKCLDRE